MAKRWLLTLPVLIALSAGLGALSESFPEHDLQDVLHGLPGAPGAPAAPAMNSPARNERTPPSRGPSSPSQTRRPPELDDDRAATPTPT